MKSTQITWLNSDDPPCAFPDIETAFEDPDGLLAAGGDLSKERLLYAYRHGIFPWFSDGQPILWWSPDPRCVMYPDDLHISRRLHRAFRTSGFEIRFNYAFDNVIAACAEDRVGRPGTWITPQMMAAYKVLHADGWAHSIEVWQSDRLVGGLYGLAIGKVCFGESMFSRKSNASKAAMLAMCRILAANDFALLDCQVETAHLLGLGATLMPRWEFTTILENACAHASKFDGWPVNRLKITDFTSGMYAGALQ